LSNLLHPWLHAERLLLLRAHHRHLTSTAVEPNTVARQLYSASACSSCAACCCGFRARSTGSCVQAAPASLGAAFALAYQVASAQTCSAAVKLQHPSLRESRMASKHRAHPWPEPSREVQLRSAYRYQTRRKRLSLSSSGVQPSSGPCRTWLRLHRHRREEHRLGTARGSGRHTSAAERRRRLCAERREWRGWLLCAHRTRRVERPSAEGRTQWLHRLQHADLT
jgi:hypothetical protein